MIQKTLPSSYKKLHSKSPDEKFEWQIGFEKFRKFWKVYGVWAQKNWQVVGKLNSMSLEERSSSENK